MNRPLKSKEHRNVKAGSRLQFWTKLANVNEYFMEREEYTFKSMKSINSKINCESAIGEHLFTNPECAKTYIAGQLDSSYHVHPHLAI